MKLRLVATAFTCQPEAGSEYEVGWRWSQAAGVAANALILTRRACFEHIPGNTGVHPIFGEVKTSSSCMYKCVDLPFATKVFVGRRFMRSHYLVWQVLALFWVIWHRKSFDLVHHICFVSAWCPPLVAFAGLPYIWGPIGASVPLPKWARTGAKARVWNFVTQSMTRFNPIVRFVAVNAAMVIPINRHARGLIGAVPESRVRLHPAIAHDPLPCGEAGASYRPISEATIVCSTRNVPIKMPSLCFTVCEILASRYGGLKVLLVGDGISKRFKTSHPNLFISDSVPQEQFLQELLSAQLLLFPTLEGSGFVALEALSRGLPTVCLEGSGPAEFIGNTGGIVTALGGGEESTAFRLADECEKLLLNEQEWRRRSELARQRARLYEWSRLNDVLVDVYGRISNESSKN
jgi:glycosyltransferase involved in cell wall biosynthesis